MLVYREIYERVKATIAEGGLGPGDTLPSARALASELGVARGTVDAAFALLSGEGYILSRARGRTVVSPDLPPFSSKGPGHAGMDFPEAADAGDEDPPFRTKLPLTPGQPALDLFPRTLWARLVGRQARAIAVSGFSYADPQGDHALRSAIVAYLSISRGVECTPDQVFVTGGYQSALGLLFRCLLAPGAAVWIEDPGYRPTRLALESAGATAIWIPVDHEGLSIAFALRLRSPASLCVVTPAHQFPLGVALSLGRRLALLDWAKTTGGWILEDDYDGEFRHQGRALPALKSLDVDDRVVFIGTFSKTLYPGLRLGYVVAPKALVEPIRRSQRWLDGGRSPLEQAALAELFAHGHFARHLKRMRVAYDSRRAAFCEAILETFSSDFRVDRSAGGLHLVLRLPDGSSDVRIAARAVAAGLRPLALSAMGSARGGAQALLVGFAGTAERDAPAMAQRLHQAIKS
jgi:GntR family transcriptional regulator/MocR family aminotransferase